MQQDVRSLSTFHTIISLPSDENGNVEQNGVRVKKQGGSDAQLDQTKNLFINELLMNMERRFLKDAVSSLTMILNPMEIKAVSGE